MAVANKVTREVKSWGILGIIIVVVSLILIKFQTDAFPSLFNGTNNATESALNTSISDLVSGFQEPSNWIAIVIIAIIGFALFYYFQKRKG